ncbi:MAG: YwaF family protein [Flavobacteriales bacterium]|nr:YwaF family protein [Flavobacteriales bacterium]
MGELDVIVSPSEPRYWAMMAVCTALAWATMRFFRRKGQDSVQARNGLGIAMLSLQAIDLIIVFVSPDMSFSIHRSLPLHFCGLNTLLIGLNCFWMNRAVFSFTTFMGMIGGAHSLLTPQLPSGDALPLLVLFFVKHAALVFVPIILAQTYGLRFRRWDWIRTYGWSVLLSTVVMGFNAILNLYFPHQSGAVANYMYVWEAPVANNPLIFDWAWPWYLAPLHVALLAHLILMNAAFRHWHPAVLGGKRLRWFE